MANEKRELLDNRKKMLTNEKSRIAKLLLEKACNWYKLTNGAENSYKAIQFVIKYYQRHKIVYDKDFFNIFYLNNINYSRFLPKKLKVYKTPYYYSDLISRTDDSKELDKIFGEYINSSRGDILNHFVVFMYLKKNKKKLKNIKYRTKILDCKLDVPAFYLLKYFELRRFFFFDGIKLYTLNSYWSKLFKLYKLSFNNSLPFSVSAQLMEIDEQNKIYKFFIFGHTKTLSIPNYLIEKNYNKLSIGDFVSLIIESKKKGKLKVNFSKLPKRNVKFIF